MSTNFLQFDPSLTNAQNDAVYAVDPTRSNGGVAGGLLASALFNKFAYQVSTFVTAFCQMLVAKGYSPQDASVATLAALLANVKTSADFSNSVIVVPYSTSVTFNAKTSSGFDLILTGNVSASTLSNIVPGQLLTFIISQDGTGGRTFPWPSAIPGSEICPLPNTTTFQQFFVRADGVTIERVGAAVWQTPAGPMELVRGIVVPISSNGNVASDTLHTEITEEVNTIAGGITRTLFTAVGFSGFKVNIKNLPIGSGSTGNQVLVLPQAGQTIDGFSNFQVNPFNSITLQSDNANWIII